MVIWETACEWWSQIAGRAPEVTDRSRMRRRGTEPETVLVVGCETLELRSLPSALTIVIDYSYDTNNFFDTQEKRDLFQSAANEYAARIVDDLTAIKPSGSNTWSAQFTNPATGESVSVSNLVVAADTIIVYAGGRDLAWAVRGARGRRSRARATVGWPPGSRCGEAAGARAGPPPAS